MSIVSQSEMNRQDLLKGCHTDLNLCPAIFCTRDQCIIQTTEGMQKEDWGHFFLLYVLHLDCVFPVTVCTRDYISRKLSILSTLFTLNNKAIFNKL